MSMSVDLRDEVALKHAQAYLGLLRERENSAGWREGRPAKSSLDRVLWQVDLDWSNIQKAQRWCAGRAVELEAAALLCRDFAIAAPDLLILRLPPADWLSWLRAGLDGAERFGDEAAKQKILENMGHAHLKNGDYARSQTCFEEQLALAGRRKDRGAIGKGLCCLANVASLSGRYAEAEDLFGQALEVAREIRSEQLEADTWGNLAILYDDSGRPGEAVEAYGRALDTARRIVDRAGEGRHLGNLAGLCKHTGDTGKAIALYREQLAIARDLKDRRTQAAVLHNLGLIHLETDDLDDAVLSFEEAMSHRRKIGDRLGEGKEWGALGIVFRRKGDRRTAVEHLTRWLDIARELGDRLEEAEALNNLGNVAEDPERSRELYEASLAIVRELGHTRGLGILLNNLGRIYDLLGESDRARESALQAVGHHHQAGNRIGEARSLWHLAKISFRTGNTTEAFAWGYQAMDIYCALRQRDWVLDLVYLMGNWAVESGEEALRLEFEARVRNALAGFEDAKTEWIRRRSEL